MRRAQFVCLALLASSLTGCLTDRPARSTSLIDRVRGMAGPGGPDAVFIEYTHVDRPLGNAAMNRNIWREIDELGVPSDTRALLAENGLRCGVVGGLLPSEIESMMQNPRSAVGSRQRRLYVKNAASIPVTGPVAQAEYRVRPAADGKETTARFENAKFVMSFTPSHASSGRINLKCIPEVEYSDTRRWTPIGAAGESWASQKPVERYQALAFEISLSPREFLVIGADADRGNWLGNQMFSDVAGNERVQRLLIIRAGSLSSSDNYPPSPIPSKDDVIPLASQAGVSAARGTRP